MGASTKNRPRPTGPNTSPCFGCNNNPLLVSTVTHPAVLLTMLLQMSGATVRPVPPSLTHCFAQDTASEEEVQRVCEFNAAWWLSWWSWWSCWCCWCYWLIGVTALIEGSTTKKDQSGNPKPCCGSNPPGFCSDSDSGTDMPGLFSDSGSDSDSDDCDDDYNNIEFHQRSEQIPAGPPQPLFKNK